MIYLYYNFYSCLYRICETIGASYHMLLEGKYSLLYDILNKATLVLQGQNLFPLSNKYQQ